jgi:hypothetical protein
VIGEVLANRPDQLHPAPRCRGRLHLLEPGLHRRAFLLKGQLRLPGCAARARVAPDRSGQPAQRADLAVAGPPLPVAQHRAPVQRAFLARPVLVVDVLAHRGQRAPARRVPVRRLIRADQRPHPRVDVGAARGERPDRRLRHVLQHPAVARPAGHPGEPEPARGRALQLQGRHRGPGRLHPVQRPRVDRPPLPVPDGLDPVEEQDVHVQLRVAVPADMLREHRDRDLVRVLGLPRPHPACLPVVAGADEPRLALHVAGKHPHRGKDLLPDPGRPLLPVLAGAQVTGPGMRPGPRPWRWHAPATASCPR